MMSFLALNLQVAEASVAMHEMPIATAAKEITIRQAMAFPFLEDVCIGRTRPSCRGLDERLRQRGEQFDEALSLVRRADRRLARKQTVEQLQLIARIRKLRRIELCKIVAAVEQAEGRVITQSAICFELLLTEHLIHRGLVRKSRIAPLVMEYVVVLVA